MNLFQQCPKVFNYISVANLIVSLREKAYLSSISATLFVVLSICCLFQELMSKKKAQINEQNNILLNDTFLSRFTIYRIQCHFFHKNTYKILITLNHFHIHFNKCNNLEYNFKSLKVMYSVFTLHLPRLKAKCQFKLIPEV